MSLLQYTSKEMFSSTELVRKSKHIFDKLNKNEIEKAIILRDGKPGIILLDFNQYEKIITEYLSIKEKNINKVEIKSFQNLNQKKENQILENPRKLMNDDLEDLDFSIEEKKNEPLKEFWD